MENNKPPNRHIFKNRSARGTSTGMIVIIGFIVLGAIVITGLNGWKIPGTTITAQTTPTTTVAGTLPICLTPGQTTPPCTPAQTTAGLAVGQPYTVTVTHTNAATGAALTEGTNVQTTLLTVNSPSGPFSTASATNGFGIVTTGSGKASTIGAYDQNSIWVSWKQVSGQGYALDLQATRNANPGKITQCKYVDIDNDGNKEWVCQVSTAQLVPQASLAGTKPDPILSASWDQIVGAGPSIGSQSTVTGVGTGVGTQKFINWAVTYTAAQANIVREIEFKFNSTANSKWNEATSCITVQWTSIAGGPVSNPTGTTYCLNQATSRVNDGTNWHYYFTFGADQSVANTILIPNNGNAVLYHGQSIVWNFASGDKIVETMYIRTLAASDSGNTDVSQTAQFNA